jgi:hypothetical protein
MSDSDRALLLDLMQPYEQQQDTARIRVVADDPAAAESGDLDLSITWVDPSPVSVEVGDGPRAPLRAGSGTHAASPLSPAHAFTFRALRIALPVLLLLGVQVLALYLVSVLARTA